MLIKSHVSNYDYIAANVRFDGKFKRHEENRKKVIDEILSNCKSVEYCGSHGRTALLKIFFIKQFFLNHN